jgi:hypothetical protein
MIVSRRVEKPSAKDSETPMMLSPPRARKARLGAKPNGYHKTNLKVGGSI